MDVLQDINQILKRNKYKEKENEINILLQNQLEIIFNDYSNYEFKDFKKSYNNSHKIIKAIK